MTDMFGPDEPEGPPDYWEDRWAETGEPEWWDNSITIWGESDGTFVPYGEYTIEDWFNETLNDSETNMELYGIDTLDIIHQLEAYGLWGIELDEEGHSVDWAHWRELYE